MTRDQIRELMMAASTPEECQEAARLCDEYLRAHPEESDSFMDVAEALYMTQSSFGHEQALTAR